MTICHSLNMDGTAESQQGHNNDCQTNKTEHGEMVGQSICQKHEEELDLWKSTCFFCACQEDEQLYELMQVFLKKRTPSVKKVLSELNINLDQKRSRPNEDDGVVQTTATTSASEESWIHVGLQDCDDMPSEDKKHSTTSSEGKTYYTLAPGKSAEYSKDIKTWLKPLSEVKSMQSCDMILAACIVVSRVGTDVEAALKDIPEDKPTILVVLHHTIDPDHVVPDSSRFTKREDMLIVDCLFNEDDGLLRCERNDTAQSTMLEWINAKVSIKETPWIFSLFNWS